MTHSVFEWKGSVTMTKGWVNEEDHAPWKIVQHDPDFVVNALPSKKSQVQTFLSQFLFNFFNVFVAQHLWRDKEKSGMECLNRVIQLRTNESNRQRVTGHVYKTRLNDPKLTCRWYTEEQRLM